MASNNIYPPGPVPTIFGGRKLTCDECGFSTRIKDSLVKHINSFHLKINDQDEGACGSLNTTGHDIDPAQSNPKLIHFSKESDETHRMRESNVRAETGGKALSTLKMCVQGKRFQTVPILPILLIHRSVWILPTLPIHRHLNLRLQVHQLSQVCY